MKKSQKCNLPSVSLYIFPDIFGKPVVEGSEEREENAAHDHVVKMRDHEVGIPQAASRMARRSA